MATSTPDLWSQARRCIDDKKPREAVCYLAELVSTSPLDRDARFALGLALIDAGNAPAGIKVVRLLAERLVHDGFLLPAISIIQQGLMRVPDEPSLVALLQRLHVRGARATAGTLAVPPPLPPKRQATLAATAKELLLLQGDERIARAAAIGCDLPSAGPAAKPVPLPLFGELDTHTFVCTVRRLHYRRVPAGTRILEEGAPGDSLIVLVSGHVNVLKKATVVGQLGQGAVLGEMALITRAPRSATVSSTEVVEYFELSRADVGVLAKTEPKVMQELAAYCRGRLLMNLLRTSPMFSRFDEATRVKLLERFHTVTIGAGDAAITQGQAGEGLFIIATGRAQVQAQDGTGMPKLLATLGPGDVFGEISLLKKQPATADVIAIETLGAIVLPGAEFQRVLAEYPDVRAYLETLSAQRLKASAEVIGVVDPDDIVVL